MILHLYFARRFAMTFLLITIVLFTLVMLIDGVEQARKFSNFDLGWQKILQLTLLKTPETINLILPLITILATIALFISLSRSSELVVTRASGRSALQALIAPVTVALIIGVMAVGMLNPIVAATGKRYEQLSDKYRSGGVSALSLSSEGLWLRQGTEAGQTVIRAWRSNADASILYDVTFITYDPEKGPIQRIEAGSAMLEDGGWTLSNAKTWPLKDGVNAEGNAKTYGTLIVPSSLTLDQIRDTIGEPAGVSIYDLPDFIRKLEQAGFSPRRHKVWLQSEFARPLFLMAMVLVASAFTMRHARFGGTGVAVLAAVLTGFGLYFIRSFTQILGENGQIPVVLSAWATPVAAVLLALGLLLQLEDG
ncbi:lipopolysaccharide export system permease protein [Sulfitobacter brevis]|uniref:Lipopolysaccharide export system permease protein n=1 Tax=Sulfitobacter brevis TaxID=74348 RepID=A0A1I1UKN3_9RHOB|nr:LPS export ABC transporter permease LptG [Sulfitobacter brevis]SFD71386.1 lipopolysaccharide export system permease protein [Sulfitobacter brevis]